MCARARVGAGAGSFFCLLFFFCIFGFFFFDFFVLVYIF